ncbi:hypothetical protein MHC_05140 [Mycoplasma haemocanis str. Illinois]|uniref:Uncharacterized protein n=1 Tax=Mycoplasma haemocanis (strain Illinois) TaxID=1111676 RepID=H6N8B2_MYCHN|nr:hypothetical protein [Mycoplasma haemocanis]AEW45884.1 hypothetical protein MHC_05140 [Mycoplasma haemocanis str. Illinois]
MNIVLKVASSLLGCGSAGVAGFGLYQYLNRHISIAEKLRGTLLSTEANATEWSARLTSLKGSNGNLVPELKAIKDKNDSATVEDLKHWCSDSLKIRFNHKEDLLFHNIQKYCAYSIKEKLGNSNIVGDSTEDGDSKLSTLLSKLSSTDESKISKFFKTIKDTSGTDNAGNKALKARCKEAYSYPFKGEYDLKFQNVKEFCTFPS